MSRAAHDDRVYALFDVPGTGFRDREGTGMFTQYHKMGWQKDFRSEDSPENQYDLSCNPVVIVGLPQDVDARSVRTQCEHQFGAVARVHRPTRVVENLENLAGKPPAAPSLESFAIVEFADDASAARDAVVRHAPRKPMTLQMAVKGTSFYTSAKASIMLIMANVVDLAVVNTIGEILMVLGKLFVTCTCAFIAYYIMNNYEGFQADGDEELSSLWLPVLVRRGCRVDASLRARPSHAAVLSCG